MPKRAAEFADSNALQDVESVSKPSLRQPLLSSRPVREVSGDQKPPSMPLVDERGELNIELHGFPKLKVYAGDLFHTLVNVPNTRFYLVLVGTYGLLFSIFAIGYYYEARNSNCIPGVFTYLHALWFSVQTAMTIGYGGDLTPDPTCLLTNIFVTAQSIASLLAAYSVLGLVYARFSRPSRRVSTVVFSHNMVLHEDDGVPRLACRVANLRKHQIIEVNMRMLVALDNVLTEEHESIFRFTALAIPGSSQVFLGLPFTIAHPITHSSPLYGMSYVMMERCDMEILVLLEGTDASTSARIQARHSYRPCDIMYNHRFATMITRIPDGRRCVDFALFDAVVPVPQKSSSMLPPAPQVGLSNSASFSNLPAILGGPTALKSDGFSRSGSISSDDGSEGSGRQKRRTEMARDCGERELESKTMGKKVENLQSSVNKMLRTRSRRLREQDVYGQKQHWPGDSVQTPEGNSTDTQGALTAMEELNQQYTERVSFLQDKAKQWRHSVIQLAAQIQQSQDLQKGREEGQPLLKFAGEALQMAFKSQDEE